MPPDIRAKNLLIEASAGSGKTYQLSNRVIARIAAGTLPARVAALTFTRKAAGEFTDSILHKLADSAEDNAKAEALRAAIHVPDADFASMLDQVVRSLPRMTLSTMDGFFSHVVRTFQYELGLTGGRFALLEGQREKISTDELLAEILGEALDDEQAAEYLLAHRRANMGKEGGKVADLLRKFANIWYDVYRSNAHLTWAPPRIPSISVEAWEENRAAWAERALQAWQALDVKADLAKAVAKDLEAVGNHRVGSGSITKLSAPGQRLRESAARGETGEFELFYRKIHVIPAAAADEIRSLFTRAAAAETGAAIIRTHAIRTLLEHYDRQRETMLRRRGKLSFSDIKHVMGAWTASEKQRIRRELVDFRLDEKTDHWLLDEFQDTSRADWAGLSPLLEEAFTRDGASVFVVGDRKQAIYGWRGGDVALFDDLIARYSDENAANPHALRIAPMAESRRSCPAVLELVNRICGGIDSLSSIYLPEVATRWKWEEHRSADATISGEARVLRTTSPEDRFSQLKYLLDAHEIGKREITCGVLLRSNKEVQAYAEFLRSEGFNVVEEGVRRPAKDSVAGALLHQLLRWLANPADRLASGVLSISPLASFMAESRGQNRLTWDSLAREVSRSGYAAAIGQIVEQIRSAWSDYDQRRARDVLDALAACDLEGMTSAASVAEQIQQLEVSQNPGAAAVHIMTIHKSKGLGFDMVVVPEISKTAVPKAGDFRIARTNEWVMDAPPDWARAFIPEIVEAEEQWAEAQRYEDLCVLYVALTRAKRGLYVFLPDFADKHDFEKTCAANLITAALGSTTGDDPFQSGDPLWHETTDWRETTITTAREVILPPPAVLPAPLKPSDHASGIASANRKIPSGGLAFGSRVHALCQEISWIDELPVKPGYDPAGQAVAAMISEPAIASYFQRNGRNITLLLEQPIDALLDDKFVSGVIDRLHLHRDDKGGVSRVEIIDFKTDAVNDAQDLLEPHRSQLEIYRATLAKIYPRATIECVLISVGHKQALTF